MQDETNAYANTQAAPNPSEQMMQEARAQAQQKAAMKNEGQKAAGMPNLNKFLGSIMPHQGKGEATTLNINQNSGQQPNRLDVARMQSLIKSDEEISASEAAFKQIKDFIISQSEEVDSIRAEIVATPKYVYEPPEKKEKSETEAQEDLRDDLFRVIDKTLNKLRLAAGADKIYKNPTKADEDEEGEEGKKKKPAEEGDENKAKKTEKTDKKDNPAKAIKGAKDAKSGKDEKDAKGDKPKEGGGKDDDDSEEEQEPEPKKGSVRMEDWKDGKSPLSKQFSDALSRGQTLGGYEKALKALFADLEVIKAKNQEFESEIDEIIKALEGTLKAIKSSRVTKEERMISLNDAIKQQQETTQRMIENTPTATVFVLTIVNFFLKAIDFITKFNPSKDPYLMEKVVKNNLKNFKECMNEVSETKDEYEKNKLISKASLIAGEIANSAYLYKHNPPYARYAELEGIYENVSKEIDNMKKGVDSKLKTKVVDDIFKSMDTLQKAMKEKNISTIVEEEATKTKENFAFGLLQLERALARKINSSQVSATQKEIQQRIDDRKRYEIEKLEQSKENVSKLRDCIACAEKDYFSDIMGSGLLTDQQKESLMRHNADMKINSLEKASASLATEISNQEKTESTGTLIAEISKLVRGVTGGFDSKELPDSVKNARLGAISESIHEATFGVINSLDEMRELSETTRINGAATQRAKDWIKEIQKQSELHAQKSDTTTRDLIAMRLQVSRAIEITRSSLKENLEYLKINAAKKQELMEKMMTDRQASVHEGQVSAGAGAGGGGGGGGSGQNAGHKKEVRYAPNVGAINLGGKGKGVGGGSGDQHSIAGEDDEESKKDIGVDASSQHGKSTSSQNSKSQASHQPSTEVGDGAGSNNDTDSDTDSEGGDGGGSKSEAVLRQRAAAAQVQAAQAQMAQAQTLNQTQKQIAKGGSQFTNKLAGQSQSGSTRGV